MTHVKGARPEQVWQSQAVTRDPLLPEVPHGPNGLLKLRKSHPHSGKRERVRWGKG